MRDICYISKQTHAEDGRPLSLNYYILIKLKNFAVDRVYRPGDAWFSSTDGVHDIVSYVHFPRMTFPVYRQLGRLLTAYYAPPLGEAKAAVPKSKQL